MIDTASHVSLAFAVVNRIFRRSACREAQRDDMDGAALLALTEAAAAWHHGLGVEWPKYAASRIAWAVYTEMRRSQMRLGSETAKLRRRDVERADLEDVGETFVSRVPSPEDAVMASHDANALDLAESDLPIRTQKLLHLHYVDGLTLRDAGAALGLSRDRAYQILKDARQRLRERLVEDAKPALTCSRCLKPLYARGLCMSHYQAQCLPKKAA